MTYIGHCNDTRHLDIFGICRRTIERTNATVATIVDLGAHHGEGVTLLGSQIPTCTRYMMVEPAPRCIEKIKQATDHQIHIELIEAILGIEDGSTKFYDLPDADASGNVYSAREGYGPADMIDVKIIDWRKIMPTPIDFVKCNIEGGEYELMEQGFFDNVQAFVIECHNKHVKNDDGNYRNVKELIDGLSKDFNIESHGTLSHKYCFISGIRKQ